MSLHGGVPLHGGGEMKGAICLPDDEPLVPPILDHENFVCQTIKVKEAQPYPVEAHQLDCLDKQVVNLMTTCLPGIPQ